MRSRVDLPLSEPPVTAINSLSDEEKLTLKSAILPEGYILLTPASFKFAICLVTCTARGACGNDLIFVGFTTI